ncbi:unnamed protein product (macronuclear) [Paramecium tetraurelia]|uniref:F-box domain-containing protein n=1 Tax=Paramecium tetraurelia TaxID=5888 RepID=A0CS62_PARTE|nr:uncharacterized protein GSPATT00009901001 [Paramecium tetraurelia]CAK73629.1 unnamed protein product [Paramecium tetraurelia]|eukprot:XP_001441026.1 hypothetical protein (macronuclear) [Paramecium tetraurelia strain d4-2]
MDQEDNKKEGNQDQEEQQIDESQITQTEQTENKNEEQEFECEQIQNQNENLQNSAEKVLKQNPNVPSIPNNTNPINQTAAQAGSQTSNFQDSIHTLAAIINNIDNQVLLQKAPLESLCNLLQIAQPGEFDDVSDPAGMKELIEQQYLRKRSDLEMLIYHVMKGYDELNQKVNLNQLEKIMRILKSKNKSIYITKDGFTEQALQCLCHHHQNHQQEQQEENIEQNTQQEQQQEEQQQQQEEQQQQVEQQQQQEEQQQEQQNAIEQNEEIKVQQEKNEVEIQTDQIEESEQQVDQDEQKLGDLIQKQKQQFEDFQQQIEENKTALQTQEEEIDQQIQQVEKQDEQQQLTQEQLEQNVEQLKHSIQRSREQIEKLTEQRDILLEKSRELAQKQQELKIQQQQILRQLKQNEEEEEENKPISCQDIFGIMTLNTLNLNQLQNYNDQTNSLIFKLSKNYTVEIKSDDADYIRVLNENSILKMLPSLLLTRHIFPFLSAFELFKIREVCGWFKEQVKKAWPIVFKREMFEQLLARDLAKNIYTVLSLQTLKGTLYFKVQNLIEAIIQAIQWEKVEEALQQEQMDINIYRPLIALLSLFNKQHEIEYPHQIDGTFDIKELAKDMKNQVIQYIQTNFLPLSFNQMRRINENLLSAPEFSVEFLASKEDKLPLYLTILLQQLYYHGLIHQTFIIDSFQLDKWKIEQEILGKRQSYNQNFLEGAYKKLLLKTYQDDGEDEQSLEHLNSDINEAQQFLRALTNLTPTENPDPDIVIRRNKTVTKIFIDIHTKMDILVQTIEQYRNQSLQQEALAQKDQQEQSVQIETETLQQQEVTEKEVQTENQEETNKPNNDQKGEIEIQQDQKQQLPEEQEQEPKKLIEEENLNQPKE